GSNAADDRWTYSERVRIARGVGYTAHTGSAVVPSHHDDVEIASELRDVEFHGHRSLCRLWCSVVALHIADNRRAHAQRNSSSLLNSSAICGYCNGIGSRCST